MSKPLQIVAHRGYAGQYPENTELALAAAVEAGATLLEFDVQLTRDRVPVLLHDDNFLRTAGNPRGIHELEFADLAEMDVGEASRFGNRYRSTPVCSLHRVAKLLSQWPDVRAFVELKRQSLEKFGVASVFDAVMPVIEPVLDQCVIISFVEEALHESRKRCPAPVGWAVRTWNKASRQRVLALAPDYLFCNIKKLPGDPAKIWDGPWEWVIYEITDPEQALRLQQMGMRYIETMQFGEMLTALQLRGEL